MDETDSVWMWGMMMFQHAGDRTHLPSTRKHYPTSCQQASWLEHSIINGEPYQKPRSQRFDQVGQTT